MSCEGHRGKYLQHIEAETGKPAAELEQSFQTARNRPIQSPAQVQIAEAKTRLLFTDMQRVGIKPPTHSASGLPKKAAQLGYAAIYDILRSVGYFRKIERVMKELTRSYKTGQQLGTALHDTLFSVAPLTNTTPDLEALGQALHRPVAVATPVAYWDGAHTRTAQLTRANNTPADLVTQLQPRSKKHGQHVTRLTKWVQTARERAEKRKGNELPETITQSFPTSMAVSVAIDMSGSMKRHITSGALHDATMILCDTLQSLEMPHEVLAFGSSTVQVKAMQEIHITPESGAFLAHDTLGGTQMADAAGIGTTSLMGCVERSKLFVSLMDSVPDDFERVQATIQGARTQGVQPFGVFLGTQPPTEKMDALYGSSGWTNITSLDELPYKVGQRIATTFNRLKPVTPSISEG